MNKPYTKSSQLDNGVKIITSIKPWSEISTIMFSLDIGSRNEKEGEKGYSHLLEHMLSKGNAKYKSAEEMSSRVNEFGGYYNASTSLENLQLFIQVENSGVAEMFEVLEECITSPKFEKQTIKNEKKVLEQEILQRNTNIDLYFLEQLLSQTFEDTPLSNSPVGSQKDINKATQQAIKKYFDQNFNPQSLSIIAVGDASVLRLHELAKHKLGKLPKNLKSSPTKDVKLEIKKHQIQALVQKSPTTKLSFNFCTKKLTFKETLAASIISNILAYQHSSVLYKKLRNELGLIYNIASQTYHYKEVSIMYFSTSSTKPEQVIDESKKIFLSISDRLDDELLGKYKKQYAKNFIRTLASQLLECKWLAQNTTVHDQIKDKNEVLLLIKNLENEFIRQTSQKILNEDNLVIVTSKSITKS